MLEKELKQAINAHLNKYAIARNIDMPDVNRMAKKISGKPRGDMSLDELQLFKENLDNNFPLE